MENETRRTEHPFHMHDAIHAQPEAFARAAERNGQTAEGFAADMAAGGRLFLVGIGTSYNAARVGEHLFRVYGGGLDARALNSFDFALYGPGLGPDDAVVAVSHRGSKRYTALALKRAREAGCRTALVTGEGASAPADATFTTVAQERSAAHTVSYTGAIAVLALLAGRAGLRRTGSETLDEALLREGIPAALRAAVETEAEAAALAREQVGRRRIWLAGGGPSAVTAEETSLKMKEASYMQAEGMPTETLLHGPFQCVEAEDLFVLVAPEGAARARTLEVAELAGEVGAPSLVVSDGPAAAPETLLPDRLTVPGVPEPFSALSCIVPLQLFAYHLALARGTNPDSFRAEDPRFARADVSGRL